MGRIRLKLLLRTCVISDDGELSGRGSRRPQAARVEEFERLVEVHTSRLFRLVRRFASDRGEAEVLVQETWLRAWRSYDRVDIGRPIFPWLARIAVNVARDRWRRRSPFDFADLGGEAETREEDLPGPEPAMEKAQMLDRLARGVAQLRPEHRVVIALRYDGGLRYEEIAAALSIPLNTVRTHLRRAKAELRSWLEVEDVRLDG